MVVSFSAILVVQAQPSFENLNLVSTAAKSFPASLNFLLLYFADNDDWTEPFTTGSTKLFSSFCRADISSGLSVNDAAWIPGNRLSHIMVMDLCISQLSLVTTNTASWSGI